MKLRNFIRRLIGPSSRELIESGNRFCVAIKSAAWKRAYDHYRVKCDMGYDPGDWADAEQYAHHKWRQHCTADERYAIDKFKSLFGMRRGV